MIHYLQLIMPHYIFTHDFLFLRVGSLDCEVLFISCETQKFYSTNKNIIKTTWTMRKI